MINHIFTSFSTVQIYELSYIHLYNEEAWAHFSKAPETLRASKAIFSSPVSKNGEVYTPETSCMKGTSPHVKNKTVLK